MSARITTLDSFRGLACLAVMLFHYLTRYQEKFGAVDGGNLSFDFGYLGVHFFFMVSGFVIFMTLQRTETSLDFCVSRFSRLYPTYWICLIATLVIVGLGNLPEPAYTAQEVAVNFTMLQSFVGVRLVDGAYWSLAYELVFYAIMLGIFAIGQMHRITWFLWAWLTVQLLYTLAKVHLGFASHTIETYAIMEYAQFFIAGILFYRMFKQESGRYDWALLLLCVLNQVLIPVDGHYISVTTEKLITVSFFAVFYAFAKGHLGFLGMRPLTYLGGISYALYLLHQAIGYTIIYTLDSWGVPYIAGVVLAIVGTIVLASMVTHWVEKPAIQLIRTTYKQWKLTPAQN